MTLLDAVKSDTFNISLTNKFQHDSH